MKIPKHIG